MCGLPKRFNVTEYSTKSVCIVDNGLFPELARTLSRSFSQVFYTSPWVADYPTSYHIELAEGFPDFERVDDIWGIVDDVDLFIFPELHQGPLQEYLAKQGKRVWGSRNGDDLELYRKEAKEYFKSLDIPQAPYEVVKGMTALRAYIKKRGDKQKLWIKISRTRGDTETFCTEGYDLAKNHLDELQAEFGPVSEFREFIVEDNLPDTFDLAIDTYSIDGKYPKRALLGNEQKDQGYIGVVKEWNDFPLQMLDIYGKVSPALEKYQYRNFFALECRTGKDGLWLGDPCMRVGSPIFELELNMISNLPEILWEGADGKLVEPEYQGKYGFECLVESPWVDKHPLLVEFPEKYRDQIKFRYAAQFPDGLWIMPQQAGSIFAAIVTFGDSIDACVAEAEEIAGEIKGQQVESFTGSAEKLKENLNALGKNGVRF
jgi:hypothetical protein